MKRVLFFAAAIAICAACGSEEPKDVFGDMTPNPDYECVGAVNKAYNDPDAPFDTLSYAMGMNLGVSLNFQQADFDLDNDIVIANIEKTLAKAHDYQFGADTRAKLDQFAGERIRPFMMQKQVQRMVNTDRPDTLPQPELYNEKYSREEVSQWFGIDMANYVHTIQVPINVKWMLAGMRDSEGAETIDQMDSVMRITADQMRGILREYVKNELPAQNKELSQQWIASIAKRSDVTALAVDADTMYYKVLNSGSDVKASDRRDTVSVQFEVFTRRGSLVESTSYRADMLRKDAENRIATMRADSTVAQERIDEAVAKMEESYAKTYTPTITLQQLGVRGAIEALKLVGKGGEITMWLPSELAYGERGNRNTQPNEAIVMTIKVLDVKPYDPSYLPQAGNARIQKIDINELNPDKGAKQPILPVKGAPAKKQSAEQQSAE